MSLDDKAAACLLDVRLCNHKFVRYDGYYLDEDGSRLPQYTCYHPVAEHCGASFAGRGFVASHGYDGCVRIEGDAQGRTLYFVKMHAPTRKMEVVR